MAEFEAFATRWADVSSIIGLFLTIVGFGITIFGVWRSKGAAEQARQAAQAARDSIASYDAVADLAAAMAIMDEIKRLQRHAVWPALPDRYSDLRRRLITIRESEIGFSDEHRRSLQLAIEQFTDLEQIVERAITSRGSPPKPDKLNEVVSSQLDEVHAVLLALQRILRSR
jgi:hypothetical protein